MKTIVIDGVEYEEQQRRDWEDGTFTILYKHIPKPKKTLVEIAAEVTGRTEEEYRNGYDKTSLIYDAIEERLAALEQRDAKREEAAKK